MKNRKNSITSRSDGSVFIISAPSGAGKTTLIKAVLDHFDHILYSVSYTTRQPRTGEQHGVDYFFISKNEFTKGIKNNKWAEWAEVHGNYYGTSAEFIDNSLHAGKNILLELDVQGTFQLQKRYPESITIFIMPPSMDTLKNRLIKRGTDTKDEIAKRLAEAKNEIAQKDRYMHIIINDKLDKALSDIISIIENATSQLKQQK